MEEDIFTKQVAAISNADVTASDSLLKNVSDKVVEDFSASSQVKARTRKMSNEDLVNKKIKLHDDLDDGMESGSDSDGQGDNQASSKADTPFNSQATSKAGLSQASDFASDNVQHGSFDQQQQLRKIVPGDGSQGHLEPAA